MFECMVCEKRGLFDEFQGSYDEGRQISAIDVGIGMREQVVVSLRYFLIKIETCRAIAGCKCNANK